MLFPDSPGKLCFGCKLFCNKDIFRYICLNYEIRAVLVYRSIFSQKHIKIIKINRVGAINIKAPGRIKWASESRTTWRYFYDQSSSILYVYEIT